VVLSKGESKSTSLAKIMTNHGPGYDLVEAECIWTRFQVFENIAALGCIRIASVMK
jgi:hypothetical protein